MLHFKIQPIAQEWLAQARAHQDQLTKPPGSLGYLEELGVRLAAIQQTLRPTLGKGAVIVCAADHGVTAEGVSAYPSEVTAQMLLNFRAGGAAINQIARAADAQVYVLDVGINSPTPSPERVRSGTGNIAREAAMTRAEAEQAIQVGAEAARRAIAEGATILAAGDMGIGNTTAAAALTAALLGLEARAVTGRGTGVDAARYQNKVQVVATALRRAQARLGELTKAGPLEVLAELGGLEIAAVAGVFLAGAEAGLPLVTDGFPVTAGALLACRINPNVRDYLFAGHRSLEPGHSRQLEALGLRPVLELDMRLGEGTGAVLSFPILRAAASVMAGMATFAQAGVSQTGGL
ncbi:nicotinate-nucleotide--dimethylbenzimidazole phosphoribosyltransferase [Meiothermus ruber]|jgi:nicotinate-nucleotide--dimethylbenzimidazole phosphoribosyltransferase|uniref:Nicotinate-nucleotide--dimethylbenzimidazole phosphoribosyltransferase n=1 Tax=Meiothermus ruber (strain ATCC 35948 / DSM 1279 / VKM B-1258 / 21) TaxID=504728 RepID=D3PLB9_MEIRD|nr:nicotinate-nucleotide--dimethylbenzimidazole phosphoribosyltransferase [Meiothermus ruber]ADD27015.1 nicotinate-nucleotide/dimethylbenzimidazole phosphoribosyltransferase [Meiothermus ruber DSM 1279]AGK03469.1 nicotinate-nucleotide--dimethylbenzimidazole phosphoribosyltransferase [Meiothermus ruber DSM 1279]MCL6531376.1 nicotinate-nucleotide--dimethylbenzimidazole phosphoribosyltransferase [Meiothermus ruber]GAO73932.1 nicotinate-nucleotide--dimethylbenzimidazole phosphoribosyltransferase [M